MHAGVFLFEYETLLTWIESHLLPQFFNTIQGNLFTESYKINFYKFIHQKTWTQL